MKCPNGKLNKEKGLLMSLPGGEVQYQMVAFIWSSAEGSEWQWQEGVPE